MARTASTMLELGTPAPDFSLPNVVDGQQINLADHQHKKGLLVMFISKHCPYVIHVASGLAQLGNDYKNADLAIVAISSNDIETHPDDAPEQLKAMAIAQKFTFPVCYDKSQQVAKAYTAACTPDFFLFNSDRKLVYRGQLDSSRPGSDLPVTGEDLRNAIDQLLGDHPVSQRQMPSIGCNIKWKPGNEPNYFSS